MKRSWGLVIVVLCGLLLVTACGAGTTAARPASGPESVRIGPYTQVFGSALPADPARAQVMQAFRQGEILWTRSEVAFRLVAPVRDYVAGQALSRLATAVHAGQARDSVPAGTDRLFRTQVTSLAGSRAAITTCDDGSKFREENPRTRRVVRSLTAQPQQEYIAETWRMGLRNGQWAITGLSVASLPSQSAEACQPGLAAGAPRPPAMPVLLTDVAAATRDASSVHLSGTVQQDGKTESLDLSMTRSGGIWGQIGESGAYVVVLATRGQTYVLLNAAFVRSAHLPAAACQLFCGKYLKTTSAQSFGLGGLSMSSLMTSLTQSIASTQASKVSFGGTIAFGGGPAWVLQDGQQDTAFVAARGRPYLLRMAGPQAGGTTLSFTQWDAVRIPGPPPASQVVNLSQLSGDLAA